MDRGPSISVVAAHKLCCGSICCCNSSKQDRPRIATTTTTTTTTTKWWTFTLGTSLGNTGCLLSSFGSISSCPPRRIGHAIRHTAASSLSPANWPNTDTVSSFLLCLSVLLDQNRICVVQWRVDWKRDRVGVGWLSYEPKLYDHKHSVQCRTVTIYDWPLFFLPHCFALSMKKRAIFFLFHWPRQRINEEE